MKDLLACDAELRGCTSPARIAELQKLRAGQLLARGEGEAAKAAMAAAAANDAAHWSRKASKHAEQDELVEAASAYERALELLRMDDAPRGELRSAEKSAREARNRVGSRLTERLRGLRGCSAEEVHSIVGEVARLGDEATVLLAWRELLRRELKARSTGAWVNGCVELRQSRHIEQALCLELAVAGYEAALEVRTREAYPEDWAMTQMNLAIAYSFRIRGEKAANLETAIERYEAALEVRTREAYPEDWAKTQMNLATAYEDRIRGEKADNVETAIEHYEAALEVYTKVAFPEDWAMTQMNLANAYLNRIRGEKAANVKTAIEHFEAALEVRTREAYPEDWATTQMNLAIAYRNRICGEKAANVKTAIEHYEAALEVYTRAAYPEKWAMTQDNLGIAYRNRICGEKAASVETAIKHFEAALEVYTKEAYPADHVQTARNLAIALSSASCDNEALAVSSSALEVLDELRLAVRDGTDDLVAKRKLTLDGAGLVATLVRSCLRLHASVRVAVTVGPAVGGGVHCSLATRAAPRHLLLTALQCIEKSRARSLAEAATQPQRAERLALERAEASGAGEGEQRRLAAAAAAAAPPLAPTRSPSIKLTPQGWYQRATSLLGPHRAAVAWFLSNDFGCAFVLAETLPLPRVVEYDGEAVRALRSAVAAFQAMVTSAGSRPDPAAFDAHLSLLASALKVDEVVAAVRRTGDKGSDEEWHNGPSIASVVLLPHGVLHAVPIHALSCADGIRVSEVFPAGASYTPSLELLARAQAAAATLSTLPPRAVIVQNPTGDLDGADQEVEHLSSLPNCDATVLPHDDATRERLRSAIDAASASGDYGLHLATHGRFAAGSRLDSAVELAGGDSLSVFDVLSRQFALERCALCVLSACESGLSDTTAEECVGLPAAMLSSGVPRTVSTLWRVSDVASALLISEMYTRLYQHVGELSVAAALRGAQIWLRELPWGEAEVALGLRFGAAGSRLLLSELRSLRGGGPPAPSGLVCALGVDEALARELSALSRSLVGSWAAYADRGKKTKGFSEGDWSGHEMSVMRAFGEGRVQWLCTDVFFMGGGLPMRDYWLRIRPSDGSSEAERYVVLHLHYLGSHDAPRFDEIAQVNVRFGRSEQNYFYKPHGQVQMGMDSGGRSWLVTGHKEKKEAGRESDTRWMGAGFTPKGWSTGSRTRDLPPWRWRTDPDRAMGGQEAEGDGQPVHYSPAEKARFRECHDLLIAAEAALQEGFSLAFDAAGAGIARDLAQPSSGASSGDAKPFASPMFWAPFVLVGSAK